jgi:uncharacterized protein YoxC
MDAIMEFIKTVLIPIIQPLLPAIIVVAIAFIILTNVKSKDIKRLGKNVQHTAKHVSKVFKAVKVENFTGKKKQHKNILRNV